ncbi:MAG: 30S ribosomal protein S2 [Candidatus Calescibacterium sp.]|nr:30S ribosomal protein S2 [Candidatus Calescibacterium sp.]MCX7971936.1 30S ribosomal protein S2 [bacterium]MDW8194965.1 30S ribosomal protein S2 [Candidatus Calescibacterium sp.]
MITTVKELLENGCHFGHPTKKWNPKMKKFIFTRRGGIYIIDLAKTVVQLTKAYYYLKEMAAEGKTFLIVGTKRHTREIIKNEARKAGIHFVVERWIGGLFTNFPIIRNRIDYMIQLEKMFNEGIMNNLPKKIVKKYQKELEFLQVEYEGVREMYKLPDIVLIVDVRREVIAIEEAKKMGLKIVGIVDTDGNPELVDLPIPSNDDAFKSVQYVVGKLTDAIVEGKTIYQSKTA